MNRGKKNTINRQLILKMLKTFVRSEPLYNGSWNVSYTRQWDRLVTRMETRYKNDVDLNKDFMEFMEQISLLFINDINVEKSVLEPYPPDSSDFSVAIQWLNVIVTTLFIDSSTSKFRQKWEKIPEIMSAKIHDFFSIFNNKELSYLKLSEHDLTYVTWVKKILWPHFKWVNGTLVLSQDVVPQPPDTFNFRETVKEHKNKRYWVTEQIQNKRDGKWWICGSNITDEQIKNIGDNVPDIKPTTLLDRLIHSNS